jgi:hypothetical protein
MLASDEAEQRADKTKNASMVYPNSLPAVCRCLARVPVQPSCCSATRFIRSGLNSTAISPLTVSSPNSAKNDRIRFCFQLNGSRVRNHRPPHHKSKAMYVASPKNYS